MTCHDQPTSTHQMLLWTTTIKSMPNTNTDLPSEISYAASKHAMESYTRSAAVELGRYDITANVVSVGPVQSGYIDDKLEQRIKTLIPMNRVGKPEDIANAVVLDLPAYQSQFHRKFQNIVPNI